MFYSTQILAKKGPLGLVWIAAHLDRQLKRNQISEASIPASVDTLLEPEAPLALRLSGQLLLGVVRIYERKVKYLQQDASEALTRMRAQLKAPPNAAVDLPPGAETAPHHTITLPLLNGSGLGGVDGDWDEWLVEGAVVGAFGTAGDGVLQFGIGLPSGSGMLSQDVSEVFGMHYSTEDERFEDGPMPFDLDDMEVERLRDAPSQTPRTGGAVAPGDMLLRGLDTPASVGKGPLLAPTPDAQQDHNQYGDDMEYEPLMLIEPEPEPAAAAGAAAAAGGAVSPAPSTGGGWTPGSMGGWALEALLPTPQALSMDQEEGPSQEGAQAGEQQQASQEQGEPDSQQGGAQAAAAAAAAPRRSQRRANELAKVAKRRVAMDADGTTLPAADVRALLADRSSLVDRSRGRRKRARTTQTAAAATAGATATAAAAGPSEALAAPGHAVLAMPSFAVGLAPQLQSLFAAAMGRGVLARVAGGSGRAARAAASPAGAATAGDDMDVDGAGSMQQDEQQQLQEQQQQEQQQQDDDYEPLMPADDEHAAGSMGGTHAWTPGTASAGRSGGNDGDTPADPEPRSGDGRHPAGDTSDHGTDADMAGVRTPGSWGKARSGGAAVWEADAERLLEADADTRGEGEEGGSVPSAAGADVHGFTARTRLVARHITRAAAATAAGNDADAATAIAATPLSASGRNKRISAASMAPGPLADMGPAPKLSLNALTAGRGRLDACRYFYEVLALGNRGLVALSQDEPYGDITVVPDGKALAVL